MKKKNIIIDNLLSCGFFLQEEVKDLQQKVSSRIDFGNA